MTDFVSTWNEESFLTTPVAPLGLIAMRGTEDMGDKVNKWLLKWRKYTEETLPGDMSTTPGMGREDFLVRATCPRFGNGEGKGLIKDSVRGLDLYILCDVGAYNCTRRRQGEAHHRYHAAALRRPSAPPQRPRKLGLRADAAGTQPHGREQHHHV